MRRGIEQGWGALKPADAIHLATAQQMQVDAFHTYNADDFRAWDGRVGFSIQEPQTAQQQLGTG